MLHTKLTKTVLFTALSISLLCSLGVDASAEWQDDTAFVSQQGDQAVVKSAKDGKALSQNKDAAVAIEWAMANAKNTVVLPGKYTINDTIDVPRPNLTLVVAEGAVISLAADSKLAAKIGSDAEDAKIVPLIYSKGLASFRCVLLTRLLQAAGPADASNAPNNSASDAAKQTPYACRQVGNLFI